MAPTALIFDLDGCIWDSYRWYASVLSRLSGSPAVGFETVLKLGANVVDIAREVGVSRIALFTECTRDFGGLKLYPGVRKTLDKLGNRHLPLGVVSSLPGALAEGGLDALGLSERFKAVIHAGNCRVAKPNPRPILQCLSWMAITPSRAVYYVGDRDVDQRAAESAGISFAWAAYGYGGGEMPADVRVDKFEELLRL